MSSSRSAIKLINSDQGHWMPPQMTGPYLIDISLHAGNRWHRGSKENVAATEVQIGNQEIVL